MLSSAMNPLNFQSRFWLSDGKIQRIRTIYDPQPFLEAAKQ